MPVRPVLTLQTIPAQQAGWDATVQSNNDDVTAFLTGQPFAGKVCTIAAGANQLPAAASFQWCFVVVSDAAAGKSALVYSDGTDWRYVMDNTVV